MRSAALDLAATGASAQPVIVSADPGTRCVGRRPRGAPAVTGIFSRLGCVAAAIVIPLPAAGAAGQCDPAGDLNGDSVPLAVANGLSDTVSVLLNQYQKSPHDYTWNAASGLFPDEADCRMTLVNDSEPEEPLLAGGILTLGNDADPEQMYYIMRGEAIDVPARTEVTVRMRYVSGASMSVTRSNAMIGVTTMPEVGMALFIEEGEIFVVDGGAQRAGSASTPTSDAMHEYTIVIEGTAPGDPYTIYQDGLPLITASLATGASTFGTVPRVFFGDGTLWAHGVSEWESLTHNMASLFYADCDGSGVLDFFDFLCFQTAFAAGDPYADCDDTGALDFFDFLCFQSLFAGGCP